MPPAARNILFLYSDRATHIGAVREYLDSFKKYSRHRVFFAPATNGAPCLFDLSSFDAVFIHYSVRLSIANHLSPEYARKLEQYGGLKVLFIQDEYDTTETARRWIERLGISIVYTCVPEQSVDAVYPKGRFPNTKFISVLTGYVSAEMAARAPSDDLALRPLWLGYRGRNLPMWYGDLGLEKVEIGRQMKRICTEYGIPADIEWHDEHRIYGAAWPRFLRSCRAMLASESGSNVFDDDGSIRAGIERALHENPGLSYEEAHRRFIGEREGQIKMNQVSPKIFETIAAGTGMVMFEGQYSGVVEADVHYISLRKDFSNVGEVFAKLADLPLLRTMVQRAFNDVIRSERFSYRMFVSSIDDEIEHWMPQAVMPRLMSALIGTEAGAFETPASLRHLPSVEIFEQNYPEPATARPDIMDSLLKRVPTKLLGRELVKRVLKEIVPASIRPQITRAVRRVLK